MDQPKPNQQAELKARVVISGVLVFKDNQGNVVAERPFSTPAEIEVPNGNQRSQ